MSDDDPAGAQSTTSTVQFNITGENDVPVAEVDGTFTAEDSIQVASGNVLDNDTDVDIGDLMQVATPGTYQGEYGSLSLSADGSYTYTLDNEAAQSLGRDQLVNESFAYTVADAAGATDSATLTISVQGNNDAPVVVTALADQTATPNRSFSWQVPADSFADVDEGDAIVYSASLADGSELPDWLSFDSATQTFSGRVPRDAEGYLDIQVTATDSLGGVARADDLSTSDVFRLSFDGSGGGGGGGAGGSTANAGVGNGTDAPPPGQDYNFNDGEGTAPGTPGAQGGDGYVPSHIEVVVDAEVAYSERYDMQLNRVGEEDEDPAVNPGNGVGPEGTPPGQDTSDLSEDASASPLADETEQGDEANVQSEAALAALLQDSTAADDEADGLGTTHGQSGGVFAEWGRVDARLAAHLMQDDEDSSGGLALGKGLGNDKGFLGSTNAAGIDPLSLAAGSGTKLDSFRGLKEGMEQVG